VVSDRKIVFCTFGSLGDLYPTSGRGIPRERYDSLIAAREIDILIQQTSCADRATEVSASVFREGERRLRPALRTAGQNPRGTRPLRRGAAFAN